MKLRRNINIVWQWEKFGAWLEIPRPAENCGPLLISYQ